MSASQKAVMSLQDQIKAELAQVNKMVTVNEGTKISAKGKVFTLPNGTSNSGPMTAIILDWRNLRNYYTGVYNPNKPVPPVCFSQGKIVEDLKPSANCQKPQNETCEGCPFDEWGSAATGRGKACKNSVRLALVGANPTEKSKVMTLDVSPTAIKSFNAMITTLQGMGKLPVQMTTEISFDPAEAFPKLVFGGFQPHDDLEVAMALREKAQEILNREPEFKD